MMAEEITKMENGLNTLSATPWGKLSACTRKMNELRLLFADSGNTGIKWCSKI